MRDSNYKSITNNKAAVTITTSLYDRRALDVTSDKPLVYSLNHLTYLVSSLAKVRETLSVDGGVERLIEILNECHNQTYNLHDNIFNSEKKLLTAWKWTLAFQCLVLIGTRGSEKIRQGLVKAGILPIIATILDSYLLIHEKTFFNANSRSTSLLMDPQVLQRRSHPFSRNNDNLSTSISDNNPTSVGSNDEEAFSFLIVNENTNANFNSSNSMETDQEGVDNEFYGNTDEAINSNVSRDAELSSQFPNYAGAAASMTENNLSDFGHSHRDKLFLYDDITFESFANLSVEQLFKLLYTDRENSAMILNLKSSFKGEIYKRYLIINILKKLKEEKEVELLDNRYINETDYDMDSNLNFLSDMYLQNDRVVLKNLMNSRIAPRNFTESGVVIPKDDDIVWSLQLLAYISKYPYLKEALQNTHLVIDMSLRDKQLKLFIEKQMKSKLKENLILNSKPSVKQKTRKSITGEEEGQCLPRFGPSASNSPQMMNDIKNIKNEDFLFGQDKLDLCSKNMGSHINEKTEYDTYDDCDECDDVEEDEESHNSDEDKFMSNLTSSSDDDDVDYMGDLCESIKNCGLIKDELTRNIQLYFESEKIKQYIAFEARNLSDSISYKRKEQEAYLAEKWSYENYRNFDIDEDQFCPLENDYDESLVEYKRVNLFPIVEKFTFLSGTDMYYWAGVIMRNSCRRNEFKGGVRQCGNLECGKWEKYPREFLKCRRCKRTKYCSRECQMKAWHCHRNWCIPSNSSSASNSTASHQASYSHSHRQTTTEDPVNTQPSSQSQDEGN